MGSHTLWSGLRGAMVAALCALFLVLAMGTALLSSAVYRQTAQSGQANSTQRTALSYLVNQIHRGDISGIQIGRFGGSDALVLPDGDYLTILYCCDGALRELYTWAGSGLLPADGVEIMPLDKLTLHAEGALLTLTACSGTQAYTVCAAPRTGLIQIGEVTL